MAIQIGGSIPGRGGGGSSAPASFEAFAAIQQTDDATKGIEIGLSVADPSWSLMLIDTRAGVAGEAAGASQRFDAASSATVLDITATEDGAAGNSIVVQWAFNSLETTALEHVSGTTWRMLFPAAAAMSGTTISGRDFEQTINATATALQAGFTIRFNDQSGSEILAPANYNPAISWVLVGGVDEVTAITLGATVDATNKRFVVAYDTALHDAAAVMGVIRLVADEVLLFAGTADDATLEAPPVTRGFSRSGVTAQPGPGGGLNQSAVQMLIDASVRTDPQIQTLIDASVRTDAQIQTLIDASVRTDAEIQALINATPGQGTAVRVPLFSLQPDDVTYETTATAFIIKLDIGTETNTMVGDLIAFQFRGSLPSTSLPVMIQIGEDSATRYPGRIRRFNPATGGYGTSGIMTSDLYAFQYMFFQRANTAYFNTGGTQQVFLDGDDIQRSARRFHGEFWGRDQTSGLLSQTLNRSLTNGTNLRLRWNNADAPNWTNGVTNPGVVTINAAPGNADRLGAGTANVETIASRSFLAIPPGDFEVSGIWASRSTDDETLDGWVYQVASGTDDLLVARAALNTGAAVADPFGAVSDANRRIGQTVEWQPFRVHVDDGDTAQLTFVIGGFAGGSAGNLSADSAWRVTVKEL